MWWLRFAAWHSAVVPVPDGRWLRQILVKSKGRSFDVEVNYVYRHIDEEDYTLRHLPLRLIGQWDATSKKHRVYLTSAAHHQLSASVAGAVYALRWEVELVFRELKLLLQLEQIPRGNKAVSECLIYASLLALAFSRKLLESLAAGRAAIRRIFERFPIERWTVVFRAVMTRLLELLVAARALRCLLDRRLLALLRHEGPDPNQRRLLLAGRAQLGVLSADLGRA